MRFLSPKQVIAKVALSRTQIGRLEKARRFPRRVKIGFRAVYPEHEIDAWMEDRLNERPTDPPEREDKSDE